MTSVRLLDLAHARSGDKGDTANVGVIAYDPRDYPLLREQLTAERVRRHFGTMIAGPVERFVLDNLHSLNFLLHGALDGGGTVSLMTDAQGKVFSTALLRMEIEVPDEVAARVRGRGWAPGTGAAGRDGVGRGRAADRREREGAAGGEHRRIRRHSAGAVGRIARGEPAVLREDSPGGVATLILNRPRKRNALGGAMVDALAAHLADVGGDSGVRVVALRGTGSDFCAGADLAEIAASQSRGPEAGLADARALGGVLAAIRGLPQPVVAVVHGRALGGGAGLATACDLVLAREDASFGYPEVHLGFVPALVLPFLRRKVGESRAFELLARGRPVGAAKALAVGLANRVFAASAFDGEVERYVEDLAARPPGAMALTKQLFRGADGVSIEEALARGAEVNAIARLTDECRTGVRRFLQRRRAGGGGEQRAGRATEQRVVRAREGGP